MEVKNREDMVEYIKKGIFPSIYKDFGCFSVDFYPFDDRKTDEEEEIYNFIKDENIDDEEQLSISKENLRDLLKANISTVFYGYRFYFEKHEQLKEFCAIIGDD